MVYFTSLLATAVLSTAALAANFDVSVGAGGFVYQPSTITAQIGDTVSFHFTSVAHDVIQSTFDTPCSYLTGGFAVTTQSSSSATYTLNITSSDPLWFFCSVRINCIRITSKV
jgi:plastocyanin